MRNCLSWQIPSTGALGGKGRLAPAAAGSRSQIRKLRSFRAFRSPPCAARPRSAAVTPLAQRGSGAAAGGGLALGRSLRKRPLAGACGRHQRVLPARSQVRSWRRRWRGRATPGAGRRPQVRQSARGGGARRARGRAFRFPAAAGPAPRPGQWARSEASRARCRRRRRRRGDRSR